MNMRIVSYASAIAIAVALAVFFWLSTTSPDLPSRDTESRRETGVEKRPTERLADAETEPMSISGDDVLSVEKLQQLCPDPFGNVSDECVEELDRRYLDEELGVEPLHYDSVGWRSDRDGLRTQLISPLLALDGITWREVLVDPEATHDAVRDALRKPECLVAENEVRYTHRGHCAADEMSKLAMLQEGCVMTLVMQGRYNPWQPEGDEDVWDGPSTARVDEDWYAHVEELDNQVDLPSEEYWRRRAEIDDAKLRFAWRLHKCTAVPPIALAWLDVLPTPTGNSGDQHQGADLLALAGRLGSQWAQFRSRQDAVELGALRQTDPALAHYKAATMREGRVSDLVVAVEYAKRSGKGWFDVAVQALKHTYTPEEIRASMPYALSVLQMRGVTHAEPEWWQTLTSGGT